MFLQRISYFMIFIWMYRITAMSETKRKSRRLQTLPSGSLLAQGEGCWNKDWIKMLLQTSWLFMPLHKTERFLLPEEMKIQSGRIHWGTLSQPFR